MRQAHLETPTKTRQRRTAISPRPTRRCTAANLLSLTPERPRRETSNGGLSGGSRTTAIQTAWS
eukprot:9378563-Alexandrium_andersonii.AAC.1